MTPVSLAEAFAFRLERDPDATFIIEFGGEHLTYRDIDLRAEAVAQIISEAGLRVGDHVALHFVNDGSWVAAVLGAWKAGAIPVILSGLLKPQELQRFIDAAGAQLVLTGADIVGCGVPVVRVGTSWSTFSGSEPGTLVTPGPDDVAALFVTSGTTGVPKLVPHTHADLAKTAEQMASIYPSTPGFRETIAPESVPPGVVFYPFGHVAGLHAFAFRLWIGRQIVLVRKFSVDALNEVLAAYRVDALQLVPAMLYELVETERDIDLSGVSYITAGTAPLPPATRSAFEQRFGVPILVTYGSTEVGPVAHVRYSDVTSGALPDGSVGRPAPGVEIRFEDTAGEQVNAGEAGEIVVRKGGEDGDWRRTGDMGRLDDDGFLFVTGRLSDMMIVGGFNVFPDEVERAIESTGMVKSVVVVAQPDERLGQIPVAGIVTDDGFHPAALDDEVRKLLAAYKVPRRYIALDRVPLTVRQKVDRRAAAQLIADAMRSEAGVSDGL